MNLIAALVFNLYISLLSCQSIKNVKVNPDKDISYKQSTPTETDNQKTFLDKLSFLKVPALNKEPKNAIDGRTPEPKPKNLNSVPFTAKDEPIVEEERSNTANKKDNMEINEELLLSNSKKEAEINKEAELEQVVIQNDDADTQRLITNESKDDKASDEELHSKEAIKDKQAQLDLDNDLKGTTACNAQLCKAVKQHGSGYKSELNVNEDERKTNPISFVLNKYIFG